MPLTVGAVAIVLLATLAWVWVPRPSNQALSAMRLSVALWTSAPIGRLARLYGGAVSISPEGLLMAFIGQP